VAVRGQMGWHGAHGGRGELVGELNARLLAGGAVGGVDVRQSVVVGIVVIVCAVDVG